MTDYTGQTTMLRESIKTLRDAGFQDLNIEVHCEPNKSPNWTIKTSTGKVGI